MTDFSTDAFAFLAPGDPFPAYGSVTEEFGPIAVGGELSVASLQAAYTQGIFPWYSSPPILWWSPNPRMALPVDGFKLHKSLRKTLQRFRLNPRCEIRVDASFSTVMHHCATVAREGQDGTWIVQEMQEAYAQFHAAGFAHSVETWVDGQLVGGLYFINIGHAVFGESMFALQPDASKIALAALVAMCRQRAVQWIDCQQNTPHLSSLGGQDVPRRPFLEWLASTTGQPQLQWQFHPSDWCAVLGDAP